MNEVSVIYYNFVLKKHRFLKNLNNVLSDVCFSKNGGVILALFFTFLLGSLYSSFLCALPNVSVLEQLGLLRIKKVPPN